MRYKKMYQNQNQSQNQAQSQNHDKIFSKMLRAGGKNYFFDVKKASNGNNYMTISESYKNKEGAQVSNRLLLFKDHAKEFEETLHEVGIYLA